MLASVDAIPGVAPEIWRGELGHLAFVSPAVRRLSLEMTDRQAEAVAAAIGDTTPVSSEVAKLQGIAVASVFQIIIGRAGQWTAAGRSQAVIAAELRPIAEPVLDEFDRWLSLSEPSS